jgi:hypothetical protein
VPADAGHHVGGAGLRGVGGGRGQQQHAGAATPVIPVDDEGVDGDLRVAQHEGQRVQTEDGEADGDLTRSAPVRRRAAGQDGEHDTVTRVLQEPTETGGRGVQPGVAGEDVLGVRVRAVLTDERQHGRQIGGMRRARHHAGSRPDS